MTWILNDKPESRSPWPPSPENAFQKPEFMIFVETFVVNFIEKVRRSDKGCDKGRRQSFYSVRLVQHHSRVRGCSKLREGYTPASDSQCHLRLVGDTGG
jgi:hypothetical protein